MKANGETIFPGFSNPSALSRARSPPFCYQSASGSHTVPRPGPSRWLSAIDISLIFCFFTYSSSGLLTRIQLHPTPSAFIPHRSNERVNGDHFLTPHDATNIPRMTFSTTRPIVALSLPSTIPRSLATISRRDSSALGFAPRFPKPHAAPCFLYSARRDLVCTIRQDAYLRPTVLMMPRRRRDGRIIIRALYPFY